ncbi:MmcQ/YjbR family DNA-binding protein [Rhodococcoides yunnanense]|uniref:MmcQ/YjbR family DNA-binding protein n=1 Tax=Rhodococcoides yunnanense TaxID=278209 RepID=UPI000934557F|nr:MmcQ/YjbR family DNA-binding protein [Rhodococcus yunnanensis]
MAIRWEQVVASAVELPKVEESTSYNTPALKVAGKLMARLRTEAEGGLVVVCGLDEKEALLASGSAAFYTTPHYDGYGSIIVDLDRVDSAELRDMIVEAWRMQAPKTVRRRYDETH